MRMSDWSLDGCSSELPLFRGGWALLEPVTAKFTEGATLHVEIVREGFAEQGRAKLPKARATDSPERDGPSLRERLAASGREMTMVPTVGADPLEDAGWSELIEERSEEHTSELQSLMRTSYAVF